MKKRLISAALVVALLVVAAVFTTQAAPTTIAQHNAVHETADTMSFTGTASQTAVCPIHGEVAWYPITTRNQISAANGSHYFLATNLSLAGYVQNIAAASNTYCLHLNGKTLTGNTQVAIFLGAGNTLNIMGRGTVTGVGRALSTTDYLGPIDIQGTLNLYGGAYTAGYNNTTNPVISMRAGTPTLNIYDGATITATGDCGIRAQNGNAYMYGGTINGNGHTSVLVSGAKFTQRGGEVKGANGTNSNVKITAGQYSHFDGSISGGTATNGSGGNIHITGGSYAMNDSALVTGGNARTGGNIYVTDGAVYILGGTVTSGTATSAGGNIYAAADGLVKMYVNEGDTTPGTVTTGTANTGNGGNIMIDGGTLNLSAGLVTLGNAVAGNGGNICVQGAATFEMTGGSVTSGTANANGGNFFLNAGSVTDGIEISGGTITGGTATTTNGGSIYFIGRNKTLTLSGTAAVTGGTAAAGNGGSIFAYNGTVSVDGATINGEGGSAKNGGAIALDATGGAALEVLSGTIKNGNATETGGNIFTGLGNVDLEGGSIESGEAPNGGNIYMNNAKTTTTIDGATVTGGTTTGSGGNIFVGAGTLDIQSGTISLGTASGYGGNIYTVGTLKMSGGLVSEGTCNYTLNNNQYSYGGGNIMVNGGTAEISDGTVENGKTPNAAGGNICARYPLTISGTAQITGGEAHTGGNICAPSSTANLSISGGTISGGTATATTFGGDTVYAFGGQLNITGGATAHVKTQYGTAVALDGAANVTRLAMYTYSATPTLKVGANYTGTSTLEFHSANYGAHTYGSTLNTEYFTADGAFTGTLLLDTDKVDAQVFGTADKTLVVAGAQIVGENASRWALNGTTAAEAAQDGEYVKLYTADAVALSKDAIIDFNGMSVSVTGEGKLYGMDSTASTTAAGEAVVTGTAQRVAYNPVTGTAYVAVVDGETVTFHPVVVRIKSVSLRPANTGIYYTAAFEASDIVKEQLTGFGVVVNNHVVPGEDFITDEFSLYTVYAKDEFTSNGAATGVMIKDIFAENADNDTRGKTPIYAKAYMAFGDGVVMSTAADHSLNSVLAAIYGNEGLRNANAEALNTLYDAWESVMSAWGFARVVVAE